MAEDSTRWDVRLAYARAAIRSRNKAEQSRAAAIYTSLPADSVRLTAADYTLLGAQQVDAQQVELGRRNLNRAVAMDSTRAEAYFQLGMMHFKAQHPDSAISLFRTAIRHDPKKPLYFLNLGVAHLQLREAQKSVPAFRSSIALDPRLVIGHVLLGQALVSVDSLAAGKAAYDHALEILTGISIPDNVEIVGPFVGQGDLIKWIEKKLVSRSITTYDLDPKINCTEVRDSLMNPPDYKDKFIITNPPYLAKNKNKHKTLYEKYGVDDLYKSFLITLVEGGCVGGVVMVPLNFFSSENSDTRLKFLSVFRIGVVNIFEEQVFSDTSYTICSFNFFRENEIKKQKVKICNISIQ